MRANYQTNLLKIAPQDKEKLLETIEAEINSIEKRNQAEISQELTNEELLEQLSLRIKQGELIIAKDGKIIEKTHAN